RAPPPRRRKQHESVKWSSALSVRWLLNGSSYASCTGKREIRGNDDEIGEGYQGGATRLGMDCSGRLPIRRQRRTGRERRKRGRWRARGALCTGRRHGRDLRNGQPML